MIDENLEFQKFISLFFKHKRPVAIILVLSILVSALWAQLQPPIYEASTSVILSGKNAEIDSPYTLSNTGGLNFQAAIASRLILEDVIQKLNLSSEKNNTQKIVEDLVNSITVKYNSGNVYILLVKRTNPELAANIANALVESYTDKISEIRGEEIKESTKQINDQIASLDKKMSEDKFALSKMKYSNDLYLQMQRLNNSIATNQNLYNMILNRKDLVYNLNSPPEDLTKIDLKLSELQTTLNLQRAELEAILVSPEFTEINNLQNKIETNQKMLEQLLNKKEEVVVSLVATIQNVKVLDSALPPTSPLATPGLKIMLIGLMLGIILSVCTVFAFELFDKTFEDSNEVESLLGVPVLATIPRIPVTHMHKVKESKRYPKSLVVESYRTLRTNLKFIDKDVKTIAITSPTPGTGKSLTSANLALIMNNAGDKVIVVDTDLRKSNLHRVFKVDKGPGLTDYLLGQVLLKDAMKKINNTLFVLPSGSDYQNPLKLLESEKMVELIKKLKEDFDYVIFDSVPAIVLSDAEVISSKTDATIMIINAQTTTRTDAQSAKRYLELANSNFIGAVYNDVNLSQDEYYGRNYEKYFRK